MDPIIGGNISACARGGGGGLTGCLALSEHDESFGTKPFYNNQSIEFHEFMTQIQHDLYEKHSLLLVSTLRP